MSSRSVEASTNAFSTRVDPQVPIPSSGPEQDYPQGMGVAQLVAAKAAAHPEACALAACTEAVTYSELNRRANQMAHYLRSLGVAPGISAWSALSHKQSVRLRDFVIGAMVFVLLDCRLTDGASTALFVA